MTSFWSSLAESLNNQVSAFEKTMTLMPGILRVRTRSFSQIASSLVEYSACFYRLQWVDSPLVTEPEVHTSFPHWFSTHHHILTLGFVPLLELDTPLDFLFRKLSNNDCLRWTGRVFVLGDLVPDINEGSIWSPVDLCRMCTCFVQSNVSYPAFWYAIGDCNAATEKDDVSTLHLHPLDDGHEMT